MSTDTESQRPIEPNDVHDEALSKAAALAEVVAAGLVVARNSGDRREVIVQALSAQAAIGLFTIANIRALHAAGALDGDTTDALLSLAAGSARTICSTLARGFSLASQEPDSDATA